MEIESISISRKSDDKLITYIFEDENGDVKQITSNDCNVVIKLKDPHKCESVI